MPARSPLRSPARHAPLPAPSHGRPSQSGEADRKSEAARNGAGPMGGLAQRVFVLERGLQQLEAQQTMLDVQQKQQQLQEQLTALM